MNTSQGYFWRAGEPPEAIFNYQKFSSGKFSIISLTSAYTTEICSNSFLACTRYRYLMQTNPQCKVQVCGNWGVSFTFPLEQDAVTRSRTRQPPSPQGWRILLKLSSNRIMISICNLTRPVPLPVPGNLLSRHRNTVNVWIFLAAQTLKGREKSLSYRVSPKWERLKFSKDI